MNNYLAKIAARSSGDQLAPAQSPVAPGMDDAFGESVFVPPAVPAAETAFVPPAVPAIETSHHQVMQSITNIFPTDTITKTVQENVTDTTRVTEIKPVYLSKYIERNHYHTEKETYRNQPVITETASQIQVQHIQNNAGETTQVTTVHQTTIHPKSTEALSSTVVLPGIDTTHIHKEPVFLQPQIPVQQHEQPQHKDKPVPTLVIGTITVEIIPAQKPVNKIINHVIKQPGAAAATATKSNYGFGLGQL